MCKGVGIVSIDPGAKYVGISFFRDGLFVSSQQRNPNDAIDLIRAWLTGTPVPHVVYEEFLMYGGGAGKSKTFNTMPELRWIGRLEEMVGDLRPDVVTAKYGASVYKASTRAWQPPAQVAGKHMYDAWRLGLWYILFQLKWPWDLELRNGDVVQVNGKPDDPTVFRQVYQGEFKA